ncbi:MAG: hypothetical protein AABY22_05855 [Nanoarchaeota archaeon]
MKIFGIIAALVLIPGAIFVGIGVRLLSKINFKVKSFKVKSLDAQYINIDLVLDVINPSKLDVKIDGYNINVFLNGIKVANLISIYKKTLKGEETSLLTLPIAIDFKKSFGQILSKEIIGYFLTRNYEKIVIRLSGNFKGEILKIPISTKIDITYTLAEIEKLMEESKKQIT